MSDNGSDRHRISIKVNGVTEDVTVEARWTLADVLREDLGLTGTHLACEHGVCGACTVALDGEAVRSCLVLAVQAEGRCVETVESLAAHDDLHPIQAAMRDAHAFQCAFCAPGVLMTISCMLTNDPPPTEQALREELSGNLCRCTGYQSIIAGASAALRALGIGDRKQTRA